MISKNENQIDKLYDDDCNDNVILFDEDNNEVEFEQIATFTLDNKFYAVLHPVTPLYELKEDEALPFTVEKIDGDDCIKLITDDETSEKVFEEYYRLLKEAGIEVD